MPPRTWSELWVRTAAAGALIVAAIFLGYEVVERTWLLDASAHVLKVAHIVRGVSASLLLATWAFLKIRSARMLLDEEREQHVRTLELRVRERTAELEQARGFTELLFNSLRERVLVTDRHGIVVKANRSAAQSPGAPLVGQRCLEASGACARAGRCAAIEALDAAAGPITGIVRVDAEGRLWELEAIPVPDPSGTPQLVLEVGRDVTERSRLEAQLRHGEKMAALGVLTAGFAHDLGNPLAALSTELELLHDEQDLGAIREALGVLRRHVDRMTRTLREMVDFARRRRDAVTDVSVGEVVDDALRLVRHDPRWKRVEVTREVPGDLPPVRMVEDHLVLVLLNLFINAADAMPSGGPVVVAARRSPRGVEILVRDGGVGMTSDVLARAATPLFTTKGGRGGTGLGLSVCRATLRAIGGDLSLESEPGRGTRVTVFIPAAGDADAGAEGTCPSGS